MNPIIYAIEDSIGSDPQWLYELLDKPEELILDLVVDEGVDEGDFTSFMQDALGEVLGR